MRLITDPQGEFYYARNLSFTNHTMQPVTTIKQMRWSHTPTERAYNIPDMTDYILIRIYLYIHTIFISQINGVLKVVK